MSDKSDAIAVMTADVNVGMNEVVSVFVAKYEDGLLAKKNELSAAVKQTKQDIANQEKTLTSCIDKTKYEGAMSSVGVKAVVGDVKIYWEKGYYNPANVVAVEIEILDVNNDDKKLTTLARFISIPQSAIDEREDLQSKLEEQNAELLGVMDLLKSVGRKERQIRGRIAELKLEQCGMSSLVNNPELLKLVQM